MRKNCLVSATILALFAFGAIGQAQEIGDAVFDRIHGQAGVVEGFSYPQGMALVKLDGSDAAVESPRFEQAAYPHERILVPDLRPLNRARAWLHLEDGRYEHVEGIILKIEGDRALLQSDNAKVYEIFCAWIYRSTRNPVFEERTYRAWLLSRFVRPHFQPIRTVHQRQPLAFIPLERAGYVVAEYADSRLALAKAPDDSGKVEALYFLGPSHARPHSMRIFGDLIIVEYTNADLAGFSIERMIGPHRGIPAHDRVTGALPDALDCERRAGE